MVRSSVSRAVKAAAGFEVDIFGGGCWSWCCRVGWGMVGVWLECGWSVVGVWLMGWSRRREDG
jgi:hypothetical protein